MPTFVLSYAVWTLYVHLIVATRASFTTLLQWLPLAQVLLRQPSLAILDEATGALDAGSERDVLSALQRRLPGTAIVVVSHRTALAAMADQRLDIDGSGVATAVRKRAAPGRARMASALER